MKKLAAILAALALTACGTPREWVRCTAHHPSDGRCIAWVIGPHFK